MEALRVLIWDHNLQDVQAIQQELHDAGLNCTYQYLDPDPNFRALIDHCAFDVVLCEYDLPDGDCITALQQVRSQCGNLPFFVVTHNQDLAVEAKLIEAGATDFILKPRLARLAPSLKRAINLQGHDTDDVNDDVNNVNSYEATSPSQSSQNSQKNSVNSPGLSNHDNHNDRLILTEFNHLLAKISTRFIDTPSTEIDQALLPAIQEVGSFFGVDACRVFQLEPDRNHFSMTYEWVAVGVEPLIAKVQHLARSVVPWMNQSMERGEALQIDDIAQLPIEAANDRQIWQEFGIKAILCVPLINYDKAIGWVALANSRVTINWTKNELSLLQAISDIFTTALHRRQTEALLHEAYQRLDFHVSNSPLAVIEWDADLRITRWSKRAEEIFGWQATETIGRLLSEWQFVHEDDLNAVTKAIKPMLNGSDERVISHNRNYTKSGAIVHCGWYNSILRDENGKIKSILSLVADFTQAKQTEQELEQARLQLEERVQERTAELLHTNARLQQEIIRKREIEAALRHNESRYRAIIEGQTELICRFLVDGTLTFVNEAYCRYFHREVEELIGQKFLPLIPAPDMAMVTQNIAALSKDLPVIIHEHRVVDFYGGIRWQQWTNRAIFNDRQEIVEYLAVGRDITEQKQAEIALIASEQRYRAVVEDQTEMVCRALADTTLTFANDAYCRYYQASKQDLIGRRFLELIPLQQRDYVKSQLAQITYHQPLVTIEYESIAPDGNTRWQQWNNRGIYNEQGELVEIQSVGRDITDRVLAEEALRQSEAKFRQLTENIRDIIWMRDISTQKLIYVSPSYTNLTGYSPTKIRRDMNFYVDQVVHPLDRNRVGRFLASLMDGELLEPDTIEYRIVRADGEERWLLDRCFPVFDALAQVYRYVGITEDITERRNTEASLQQSQATNNALISALPDLLIRMRSDGTYLEIYPSERVQIYKPNNTFVGVNLHQILPFELATQRMHLMHKALQTGEIQFHEYALEIDGKLHHEEARVIACGDDEVLAIIRNIDDRKEAEARIMAALAQERELNELKSRFVSITSHEFRNPLAIISAAAQALERYGDRLPEEKKLVRLKRIQAACNYMATLLNDILVFGKAEAGMLEFHPAQLNLAEWCGVLLEDFRLSQEVEGGNQNQVKLHYQVDPDLANGIWLDERLLRHILVNLLSNAVKYSPDRGQIDFVVSNQAQNIIFKVVDRGLGIPRKDLPRLFEPFHRAQNVRDLPGTGLGMSIVKKSVDMHGGEIQVETEIGKGSTFTVILPSQPKLE
ncbi:multi-sensor signal transduction histidine kinase [Thalassoporum mexicanum PCC 7367]|uniref:PAS domain S-box protein n=1 Tax=Thalassoporum mexicanum TaxID=3457544 RepID=UPI00029FEA42|nr:PAS domain S-box protein [Pseudanabaena sp. PCC 7367]AFY70226.1 multi-sensor signal transduction histidine kinase [Pseudanabaena sp. PCC 7367]